jgi:GNAT superfamily N-acetyltransferase
MRITPIAVADTRPLRQAVLRPHETLEYLAEHELPDAFAVGAFDDDDRLVGVGFISPDGKPGDWRVRGMATEPALRGRGAGTSVLAALVDHARACGASRVWCNARIAARTFYERAGFRVVSAEFDVPEIGPHYVMEIRLRRPAPQAGSRRPKR